MSKPKICKPRPDVFCPKICNECKHCMTTSRIARNWWCNTNPPLYQLCHTKNRDGNCPDYEPKTDASTPKQ